MSELERQFTPCQRLRQEARAWQLTQHDYLDALDEAVICLYSFGASDVWRESSIKELLRRLLRARVVAGSEGSTWAEYKKALGLTG